MESLCTACDLFFFNDTATTEIYTLSLHDALPIWISLRPVTIFMECLCIDTAKLSKTNAYVKLFIWFLIWIRLIIALVPPSKDNPTTAAKKTQAGAKNSQNLTLWNATCYFLCLPKRSILELETQISNAVDNSTKKLFVSCQLDHFAVEYWLNHWVRSCDSVTAMKTDVRLMHWPEMTIAWPELTDNW